MEENLHDLPDYPTAADCAAKFDSPATADRDPILTVVGWLWSQDKGKRVYTPAHANIWAEMIDRHLSMPHRFVLMTDLSPKHWNQFSNLIEPRELWSEWRNIKNPSWPANRPNCYVRLKAFSEEAREYFGDRFVSIDLDCVVVGDLDPLFKRDDDFVIIRRQVEQRPRDQINPYQASMWLMTAGARKKVYEQFKGEASIRSARLYMGTDQAWITKCLGPDEKGWTAEDGVYGFSAIHRELRWKQVEPPAGARIVFFYGGVKPESLTQKSVSRPRCNQCGAEFDLKGYTRQKAAATYEYPWVARHYRTADNPKSSMVDLTREESGRVGAPSSIAHRPSSTETVAELA